MLIRWCAAVSCGTIRAVSDDQPERNDYQSSTELSLAARAACGVVAVAAGVPGAIGVFAEGTNSGGVPVLLVLAALFGYLGISGQRLTRLKIGEHEAGFGRVVRAAEHVLKDPMVPEAAKGEVAEALEDVRPDLPTATRRSVTAALDTHMEAVLYEQRVRDALTQMFDAVRVPSERHAAGGIDAIVTTEDRAVYVDIRYATKAPPTLRNIRLEERFPFAFVPDTARLLLISNQPLNQSTTAILERENTRFVQWRDPADNEDLERAVNAELLAD